MNHLFSSKDEDTAKEFLLYAKMWAEKFNKLLGEDFVPLTTWTKEQGFFKGGSRIIVLSSNPKAMRSQEGDVTLDEWAFHEQAGQIYDAAQPCIMWLPDAQFELISTHNGVEHEFYRTAKAAQKNLNRFSHHRVTLTDAVDQGLALKIWQHRIKDFPGKAELDAAFLADVRSGCRTEEAWQQEYCCEPALTSALVSPEQYDACAILDSVPEALDPSRRYNDLFVGIDCGRSNDLTATTVLEQGIDKSAPSYMSDVYRYVAHQTVWNTPFPIQEKMVRMLSQNRYLTSGLVDMGSVGRGLADIIKDETGGMIELWAFTAPRKMAMAERVRQYFQQRRIAVPKDDKLKADICCVRKMQTEGGSWKYDGQCEDSHGDRFWSLALALEAAEKANPVNLAVIEQTQRALPAA